ncbi:MAG TPA: hypothetical protein VI299_22335 [Polyangiales bacterium]
MRHARWLWLCVSLVWGARAQAEAPLLKLDPANAIASDFRLAPPCLGCKHGLRVATRGYAAPPAEPAPPAAAAVYPLKKPQYALGESWSFGGRTLSIRLTPTPEECAPLVRLSF